MEHINKLTLDLYPLLYMTLVFSGACLVLFFIVIADKVFKIVHGVSPLHCLEKKIFHVQLPVEKIEPGETVLIVSGDDNVLYTNIGKLAVYIDSSYVIRRIA
jgi:hypothetical protein